MVFSFVLRGYASEKVAWEEKAPGTVIDTLLHPSSTIKAMNPFYISM